MIRDDSPGPLDEIVASIDTQEATSHENSHEQQAQVKDHDIEEDEDMKDVVQESQHNEEDEEDADSSDDEEGPVTRGGRSLRVSCASDPPYCDLY